MKQLGDAVMVILLITVGILVGLAIAIDTPAESWLKYWDTLIAGLLAVVAAAITVIFMIRVDASQQRRHEQVFKLAIRSDALLVERANGPYPAMLRNFSEELTKKVTEATTSPSLGAVSEIGVWLAEFKKLLSERALQDATKLFPSKTYINLRAAELNIENAIITQENALKNFSIPRVRDDNLAAIGNMTANIAASSRSFADGLERLLLEYSKTS